MKKFIFLDIDGVLATTWHKRLEDGELCFNEAPVRNFNDLCTAVPDAKIIITSTWRLGRTVDELRAIFKFRGFLYPERIIDKTLRFFYNYDLSDGTSASKGVPRGVEIAHWMDHHLIDEDEISYLILDDDSDMMLRQGNHFLRTNSSRGLTSTNVKRAIKILNG